MSLTCARYISIILAKDRGFLEQRIVERSLSSIIRYNQKILLQVIGLCLLVKCMCAGYVDNGPELNREPICTVAQTNSLLHD